MTVRRLVLGAIALVAVIVGPFATSQLMRTAERSPALLLADVAVGWSMIAAGLILLIGKDEATPAAEPRPATAG